MMLYPNKTDGGLRSWRGRRHNFQIIIKEVFNEELQVADKYSIMVSSSLRNVAYNSAEEEVFYKTVDLAKNAAIKFVNTTQQRFTKEKEFRERPVYLLSCNIHNFRHAEESPVIMGLIHYTPAGLEERLCFKVKYQSDNKIDYIAYSEWLAGNWQVLP